MQLEDDPYTDPEAEDDWIPPPPPTETGLIQNTRSWGPFYLWMGRLNPRQRRLSVAVTRQITPPWKRGLGLCWRIGYEAHALPMGYAVGIWVRGRAPRVLREAPLQQDLTKVVLRSKELDTLPDHG